MLKKIYKFLLFELPKTEIRITPDHTTKYLCKSSSDALVAPIVLSIVPTAADIASILAPAISIVITVLAIKTIPVAAIPKPTEIAPNIATIILHSNALGL